MFKTGRSFPYLIICLLTLIVYLPSFSGEFILDDIPLIQNNTYIREWHSLGSYLTQEDGYDINIPDGHTGYYRPLINLSYTLDYKVWGNIGPGFRITNLVLHLLVSFLLFYIYRLILKNRHIALWLALIFALHPIATESVSWVTSRNNLLTALFGILSFIFYIKAYEKERIFYYGVSILFFAFSVFCKEFGLMLLPILFLYQRSLNPRKMNLTKEIREYIPYILLCVLYFYFRHNATGSLLSPNGSSDFFERLYYLPYVVMLNTRLIFFPYNMHSFIIEKPENYLNAWAVCGIIFAILVMYLLWKYRKNRLLLFSAVAFLFAIFPVSGLVSTSVRSLIAMRWLYYSACFVLIMLAEPFEILTRLKGRIFNLIITCIVLYLGVNSYMLNKYLWHSEDVFYRQEALNFNNQYYAAGLARLYLMEGNNELAEEYFNINAGYREYRPDYDILHAAFLIRKGDVTNALSNVERAKQYLMTKSHFGQILNIKGQAYLELNDPKNALAKFNEAGLFLPEQPEIMENMGRAYGEIGNHAMAVDSFKNSIRHQSRSGTVYDNLALSYILNNECQKAITLLDRKGFKETRRAKGLLERAKRCVADGEDPGVAGSK